MDKLILITNDDGYQSQGIAVLTRLMKQLGDVIVVAPDGPRSGAACSITCTEPVRIHEVAPSVFACSGTPVDCVKIALEKIVPRTPDLVVSGINHGDNISVSVHYSGTMGACIEAATKSVPSIGFSLRTRSKDCDFTPYEDLILDISRKILAEGLPEDTCLNVNFPELGEERDKTLNPFDGTALSGTLWCRQARGTWRQEWKEVNASRSFTLTGYFVNLEPEADDTDCWAVDHGYASAVITSINMTHR